MSQSSVPGSLDLEKEYIKMNQALSIDIIKYITISFYFILITGMIRAILKGWILWTLLNLVVMALVALVLNKIWSTRKTYQKGITIFCILFYLSGLIIKYLDQEFFQTPYDSFYFSYSYAILERLLMDGISNLKHRVIFGTSVMLMHFVVLPRVELFIYVVQVFMLSLSIFSDLFRDQKNKHFFYSYLSSREQLSKFKDLVVNHIPEAVVIVSQDLTKNLFMNMSFKRLVESVQLDVQSQLRHFMLKEELNSASSITSIESFITTNLADKTLFDFITKAASDIEEIQRKSCVVTCKIRNLEIDVDKENQLLFEVKLLSIIWDNVPSIAIILHDITEHHTIMSLKIADTQKDKVLATVSHELKTPLNGMLGMIQIMEKKINDTELLRFLTICKNSTNLLVSLVSSILDLNQIKAKKIKLNIERVDVHDLLRRIISLFEYQCQQKGIYLNTNIAERVRYIMTDKDRLSQILINLVGNAHKFTSNGGIVINTTQESQNAIRFSVEDTGMGIKTEDKGKLFRVFGRLSTTNEKINREGVGLGLTISENLVQVLNNSDKETQQISVESEYGKGSKFSFTILNRSSQQKEEHKDDEENFGTSYANSVYYEDLSNKLGHYATQTRKSLYTINQSSPNLRSPVCSPRNTSIIGHSGANSPIFRHIKLDKVPVNYGPCILLVDDNTFNIAVAEHLILSHGYAVKTALSGQNAIDIVTRNNQESQKISLILMDCQMPIMDGYETTKILKRMMSAKKIPAIPIVALTANDSEGDKEACKKAGMVDHLSKPLKDAELERILKKYL